MFLERFEFYERAKKAYAIVVTGESAIYANVILKKGGRGNNSTLVKYTVNPDGSLTPLPDVYDTEGVVACHLDVVDGEAYVVNYLSGNVVKIGGEVSQHEGKGPNEKRQDSAHTHYVGAMRDGNILVMRELYCRGLDTGEIIRKADEQMFEKSLI